MSFYKNRLLPKFLNWVMKSKNLDRHRMDVVSGLSGTGLEIGFGSGLNLPYYKDITKLYALEPSQKLYEIAERNFNNASFAIEHLSNSAERIPLPDNHVDFVVSTWTLCSIPQPEVALREVSRVLKPGGVFSFVEHGKSPQQCISRVQSALTPVSKCVAGGCHLNRDIEQLVVNAGFRILKLKKISQKYKPLGFTYEGVAIAGK